MASGAYALKLNLSEANTIKYAVQERLMKLEESVKRMTEHNGEKLTEEMDNCRRILSEL